MAAQGMKVFASENVEFSKKCVQIVSAHAVTIFVDKKGEIGIIGGRIGRLFETGNAGNALQLFAIDFAQPAPMLNFLTYRFELQQTKRGLKFIHLRVSTRNYSVMFSCETKISS